MGLLDAPSPHGAHDFPAAARQMESMLLQKMLVSSGVFKGGAAAGSQLYAELFAGALTDAVEKSGGIGLARLVERSLGGAPAAPGPEAYSSVSSMLPAPQPSIVDSGTVTSGFGSRADPFDGHLARHQGTDIAAPEGSPIHAFAAGVVVSAGPRGGTSAGRRKGRRQDCCS